MLKVGGEGSEGCAVIMKTRHDASDVRRLIGRYEQVSASLLAKVKEAIDVEESAYAGFGQAGPGVIRSFHTPAHEHEEQSTRVISL